MVIYEISSLINYRIKWCNDNFTLVRQALVACVVGNNEAFLFMVFSWFPFSFEK